MSVIAYLSDDKKQKTINQTRAAVKRGGTKCAIVQRSYRRPVHVAVAVHDHDHDHDHVFVLVPDVPIKARQCS
jgi:hypothetical protein